MFRANELGRITKYIYAKRIHLNHYQKVLDRSSLNTIAVEASAALHSVVLVVSWRNGYTIGNGEHMIVTKSMEVGKGAE